MKTRTAKAEWAGTYREGQGTIAPGSGTFEADYSYGSIHQGEPGTNPLEILGASLAGCYCGGLAALLSRDNYVPTKLCTNAEVRLEPVGKGFTVANIHLHTEAEIPGIDQATLTEYAERAKCICPVGQALAAIEITVQADLV